MQQVIPRNIILGGKMCYLRKAYVPALVMATNGRGVESK